MRYRLLALVLALGVVGLPAAAPAAASSEVPTSLSALVVVDEGDMSSLLASGMLGEYALLGTTHLDSGEAALTTRGMFDEHSLLTPTQLGLDTANNWWGAYWRPFIAPVVVFYRPWVPLPRFAGPVGVIIVRR